MKSRLGYFKFDEVEAANLDLGRGELVLHVAKMCVSIQKDINLPGLQPKLPQYVAAKIQYIKLIMNKSTKLGGVLDWQKWCAIKSCSTAEAVSVNKCIELELTPHD